jgi:transcriptional antiterminator NusG
VKQSLEERIERMGLQDKFGEILVPTEEVVEMKEGSKRRSERKFFPGYVLVQMEMDDETWHLVKEVPKVLGFIGGSSDRPAPISDKEADQILQRVREGVDKPRPKVLFEPGEVVRVTDGPFNDFSGVVEAVTGCGSDFRQVHPGGAGFRAGGEVLGPKKSFVGAVLGPRNAGARLGARSNFFESGFKWCSCEQTRSPDKAFELGRRKWLRK